MDKMIYWTYKHREQTPFLMTKNNRTVASSVSGSSSISSFERWNPDKPKQHNQTHRSFTEVRLSSERGIQHLNLGCKILAFYKMAQVSTGFYLQEERLELLNKSTAIRSEQQIKYLFYKKQIQKQLIFLLL